MKAIDLIRWALQFTDAGLARLVEGVRHAPLTPSTPGAQGGDGNHAVWVLGHLCTVEGALGQVVRGDPNPVERWFPLFGTGTQPHQDAAAYPSFDELLTTFRNLRAKNLRLLDEIGEAGLDAVPPNVPPGFEDAMQTVGQTFLLIAMHNMVHYGQVTDVRRVAGVKPLM